MKQHCVNLELSKRLQELGVEIETEFVWKEYEDKTKEVKLIQKGYPFHNLAEYFELYPAPLLSELLEIIPTETVVVKISENKFRVYNMSLSPLMFNEDTPQDALAKTLIHIIEQKLWNPKK